MRSRSIRAVLFTIVLLAMSAASFAQFRIAVSFGPPPLPVYEQPLCPGEGYIWTPGYWAWSDDDGDYYWVPGTWVMAPQVGYLWTPPYWGWNNGAFAFYDGYWGPRVGFYGGINYGFGYFGEGFEGGRWNHGRFFYNRSVTNINVVNIHNVYNTTVVHNTTVINRVSYNGGNGGVMSRPSRRDEKAMRERHIPAVSAQTEHMRAARSDRELRASENRGRPPVAATARPGDFRGNAVPAREAGGAWNPPSNRGNGRVENTRPQVPVHPRDLPPRQSFNPPNTGNAKHDQKFQQQEQKLERRQDTDRQKLQQRQEKEDQRVARQANNARSQQVEQRHQQQTQQLQQRHEQQQQKIQQRAAPRSEPSRNNAPQQRNR